MPLFNISYDVIARVSQYVEAADESAALARLDDLSPENGTIIDWVDLKNEHKGVLVTSLDAYGNAVTQQETL